MLETRQQPKIPELRMTCHSDCSVSLWCLIMMRRPFGTHFRRKQLMGLSTCKLRQSGSLCVKSNKMRMIRLNQTFSRCPTTHRRMLTQITDYHRVDNKVIYSSKSKSGLYKRYSQQNAQIQGTRCCGYGSSKLVARVRVCVPVWR